MPDRPNLEALFTAIDRKDVVEFARFLAPDCFFRFGGGAPVVGREAIAEAVAGFFGAVGDLSHRLIDWWPVEAGLVCHGMVRYTRLDGSALEAPFSNVLYLTDSGLIRQYLIFTDNSALFAA
ncbi:MAG: nuclear transport factor 2 family protein [Sulfuricellaceae bacterium]